MLDGIREMRRITRLTRQPCRPVVGAILALMSMFIIYSLVITAALSGLGALMPSTFSPETIDQLTLMGIIWGPTFLFQIFVGMALLQRAHENNSGCKECAGGENASE